MGYRKCKENPNRLENRPSPIMSIGNSVGMYTIYVVNILTNHGTLFIIYYFFRKFLIRKFDEINKFYIQLGSRLAILMLNILSEFWLHVGFFDISCFGQFLFEHHRILVDGTNYETGREFISGFGR